MKKVQKSLLVLLAAAAVMPACKKGEEDPFLSLRSRKSRVSGEWKIASREVSSTDITTDYSSSGGTTYTYTDVNTEKYDGATATSETVSTNTQPGSNSTTSKTSGVVKSMTYTIEKDGTWKGVEEIQWNSVTSSSGGLSNTYTVNSTVKTETSGTWAFLGKDKGNDMKSKESIVLSTTSMTTTTTDVGTGTTTYTSTDVDTRTFGVNEMTEVWKITQLKNKEMMVEAEMNNTSGGTQSYSSTGFSSTTNNDKYETKGTAKMTLSQE